jgi:hypothetical protein
MVLEEVYEEEGVKRGKRNLFRSASIRLRQEQEEKFVEFIQNLYLQIFVCTCDSIYRKPLIVANLLMLTNLSLFWVRLSQL